MDNIERSGRGTAHSETVHLHLISGMMPLWIFTAGAEILDDSVTIPILEMFMMLIFLLTIPTVIGILIRQKKPSLAEKIVKYLRPVTYIVLLLLLAIGIYVNLYILKLLLLLWHSASR